MKTVNIKGKEYVEVSERIKYFRENFKTGAVETEMLSNENGMCVFKATIKIDDKIVATGHAYEKEGSTFINKTSYIENCETSAVGRALGILGIGVDTSIATADEILNAVSQKTLNDNQIKTIDRLVKDTNSDPAKFLQFMGVSTYNEILESDYKKAVTALQAKAGAK